MKSIANMIIHLSYSVMIDHVLILITNQNFIPDCVRNKMRSSQSTKNITSYLPFINSIHCIAKFEKITSKMSSLSNHTNRVCNLPPTTCVSIDSLNEINNYSALFQWRLTFKFSLAWQSINSWQNICALLQKLWIHHIVIDHFSCSSNIVW